MPRDFFKNLKIPIDKSNYYVYNVYNVYIQFKECIYGYYN